MKRKRCSQKMKRLGMYVQGKLMRGNEDDAFKRSVTRCLLYTSSNHKQVLFPSPCYRKFANTSVDESVGRIDPLERVSDDR